MRNIVRQLTVLISLFSVATVGLAQTIVHIENKRFVETKEGFSGKLELSANFVQNVNDIFQSVNNFQSNYYKNKNNFLVSSNFNLTIFNKARVVNEGFVHFRYGRKINKLITIETFAQAQYNEIIKIQSRYLTGLGPRFAVIKNDSVRLFLGALLMPELETETTGIVNRHLRVSHYISFGFPIADRITFDLIGYFQPDLFNVNDFRISGQAIMEMKLTKKISFLFAHSLFHDTRPPEGIRILFYNFRNGLTYEF
jgi:hypothetical protein